MKPSIRIDAESIGFKKGYATKIEDTKPFMKGVLAERKRIIDLYEPELCLDYRANKLCDHDACALYGAIVESLSQPLMFYIYACKCGFKSKWVLQDPNYEPNVFCPQCSTKMEKTLENGCCK